MNDLNSILITGKATSDWQEYSGLFFVENQRRRKVNGEWKDIVIEFTVQAVGEKLRQICRDNVKTGVKVRVVGTMEDGYILLDHMEVV